jgi:hypothetical protein
MRQIDIIIPSRGRLEKLKRLLATIPGQAFGIRIVVRIVVDGDMETYLAFRDNSQVVTTYFEGHHGSVFLRNWTAGLCDDAVLFAVDDMEFRPGAIESAIRSMRERFPGGNGVIGFTQEGQAHFHPAGVVLMGQRFLQRYPEKKPYFPGYFLFACQEITWLTDAISKAEGKELFYLDPNAVILHNHPCEHPEEMDQTHRDGRIRKADDMALIKDRQAKGMIWGWK